MEKLKVEQSIMGDSPKYQIAWKFSQMGLFLSFQNAIYSYRKSMLDHSCNVSSISGSPTVRSATALSIIQMTTSSIFSSLELLTRKLSAGIRGSDDNDNNDITK
jgi:hypothetical protein